jgi:tetratricopeptide (TPR) repeat protein
LQADHANYAGGRWEAAAVHYQRLLRFTPQHVFSRWGLADALMRAGRLNEAIAVLREGLRMSGSDATPLLSISLARALAALEPSRTRASRELQEQTTDPILLAELYGSLGESARAFELLDRAADMRHYRLSAVNMFPQFDPLRDDPRYGRLLKRIGLGG